MLIPTFYPFLYFVMLMKPLALVVNNFRVKDVIKR